MPPLLDKRRLTDKALSLSEYSSVTNHATFNIVNVTYLFRFYQHEAKKIINSALILQHVHSTTQQI